MNLRFCSRFLLTFCVILFCACTQKGNDFIFKGELTGITQTEFYVYGEDADFTGIDTIRVVDGAFEYRRTLSHPIIMTLLYPNFSQTNFIAEPGGEIEMTGDAAKLGEAVIRGTEENELLNRFQQEVHDKKENEQVMAATHFIGNHLSTQAAIAVFKKYFLSGAHLESQSALPLLDDLKRAQPKSRDIQHIENRYRAMLSAGVEGQLPSFEATTVDSVSVSHQSFAGKPLVIGFFSTWINKNYQVVPVLRNLEKTYGDSLGILAVSLDYDLRRCRTRVEQDSLEAPVVCDQKAFSSPLVMLLGVRYLPGNLLVDRAGKIVARDIPLTDLEKKVKELMNQPQ